MKILKLAMSTIASVTLASSVFGASVTFNETELAAGIVNGDPLVAGDETAVTVNKSALTVTARTNAAIANPGRVRTFRVGSPQGGLWFGATVGNNFSSQSNNETAPADAIYELYFSQAVTSLSFSFDYLTDTSNRPQPETLSEFATENGAAPITTVNLANVRFDNTSPASQAVVADVSAPGGGAGSGTILFDNGDTPFTSFFFRHQQTPRHIGFTVNTITVDLAPVPLPAGAPLLLVGLGGLIWMRRRAG